MTNKLSLRTGRSLVAAALLSMVALPAVFPEASCYAKNGSALSHYAPANGRAKAARIILRNAIGVPITPRETILPQDVTPIGLPQTQPSVNPPGRIIIFPTQSFGGTKFTPASPASKVMYRGSINGSSVATRLAPSGLGGPAKPVGGINGMSFGRKR